MNIKRMFVKKINNKTYYITKSTRANKKYDVYDSDFKKLTSFGDKRYQHYHDRFGLYSSLDHWDPERRRSYRSRHVEDHTNPKKAGYWSWSWLW